MTLLLTVSDVFKRLGEIIYWLASLSQHHYNYMSQHYYHFANNNSGQSPKWVFGKIVWQKRCRAYHFHFQTCTTKLYVQRSVVQLDSQDEGQRSINVTVFIIYKLFIELYHTIFSKCPLWTLTTVSVSKMVMAHIIIMVLGQGGQPINNVQSFHCQ